MYTALFVLGIVIFGYLTVCADKTRKVLMNGEWRNEH